MTGPARAACGKHAQQTERSREGYYFAREGYYFGGQDHGNV